MAAVVVTQITQVTGSRSKVYIDDEFAFVLYKGELRHYKITEGEEIAQETIEEIVGTVLPKRAKLRGMALLKNRPYTKKQMQDKLKQGFYPDEVVNIAIEYLQSFGYINDAQYAGDYIEYHSETKSRKRLEQDLLTKGISKEDISGAFRKWQKEGGEIDEARQIREWIRKKSYDLNTTDRKEKQRMMAFLFRKGFDANSICKVLNCDEIF